jgi:hypothetical protein
MRGAVRVKAIKRGKKAFAALIVREIIIMGFSVF